MTVAFGVPVNVTVALAPKQIVALDEIDAVGGGITVIVTVPLAGTLQPGEPVVATLMSVKVVVDVKVPVMVAVPEPFKVTIWLPGVPVTV